MTEAYPPTSGDVAGDLPYAAPADIYDGSESPDGGDGQGKAGAAKEQAAAVGQGAAQAGQQVASTAKDEAQKVVAETGNQAKDLLHQARSELSEHAGTQQQRLAAGLRSLGDELESMANHSEESGTATNLAKQAASRSRAAAAWLESREPSHVMRDVQDFARQRPGMFFALAAGAGVVAGRLGRGIKDAGSDDASSSGSGNAGTRVDTSYAQPSAYTATPETVAAVDPAVSDQITYTAPADATASTFPSVETLGDEPSRVDRDLP
jgi:hypothetical protein